MPKHIILLMTDQHRLDHAGFAGGTVATPNLDRIAGSVGFTRCLTVNPVCTPARSALLTGRYSRQVGQLQMSGDLSQQIPTYPQALQRAGYHTVGIGKFHLLQTWPWDTPPGCGLDLVALSDRMRAYGFDQVWETAGKQQAVRNYCEHAAHLERKGLLAAYRDFVLSCGPNFATPNRRPEEDGNPWPFAEEDHVDVLTGDRIVRSIVERPRDRPFFVFGSFCSPHKPFDPPARYLDQIPYEEIDDFIPGPAELSLEDKRLLWKKRRAYKAMVRLIDDQIGRVFRTLEDEGLLQDTVILFTSDHGEMMGDHFLIQKQVPWKESVLVPTAIRHPDHLRGAINASPVEIIDLAATILDIAGLDPSAALAKLWPAFNNAIPCRSLMPIVRGEADRVRDFAYAECNGAWSLIQDDTWKYIRHTALHGREPREELYHLPSDPDERHDRAAQPEQAALLERMRQRYLAVLERFPPAQTSWAPLP